MLYVIILSYQITERNKKMEIKISDVIKNKRRESGLSQEDLAEAFGITVQAVSKWETGLSYPDILMLPKIAEYFKICLDELFFGASAKEASVLRELPDDDKLRVVQCLGDKVLKNEEYRKDCPFELVIPENKSELNFEIWGGANIKGDISGYANSGGGMNCGGVGGAVNAGGGVNCGGVEGMVNAGGGVNCGGVNGDVNAGGSVNCGDVANNVHAGSSIRCNNINGNATANVKITCKKIKGDVKCDGKIVIKNNIDDEDDD